MAETGAQSPAGKRKLSKREQVIIFVTSLVVVGVLLYQFPYLLFVKATNTLKATVETMDKDVVALSVQIADLKAREADIRAGAKSGIAGWNLTDPKGVVMVLEGISAEAKKENVSLVAVHPSQELDKDKYKEVSMNLDLKGRYRDLAEYFKHLENLSQIVNIRKVRVEACPDSSSACATQLEAVTYMEK